MSLFGLNINCIADSNGSENLPIENKYRNLYKNDYEQFWSLMWSKRNEAFKCKNTNLVVDFIEVDSLTKGNAEIAEFFAEQYEELFLNNPECLLKALLKAKRNQREYVVNSLSMPIFNSQEKIRSIFKKYRDKNEYKEIIKMYFKNEDN
jgi:hypothetical protein